MPTPSEPTVPIAQSEPISRSSFTSCPPDERDFFATREPLSDIGDDTIVTRTHHGEPDETTIARHDTPTPEDGSSSPDMSDLSLSHQKEEQDGSDQTHSEDVSIAASPEASSDCDSAVSQASIPERRQAVYADHLSMQWRKPAVTTSFLRPGSKFHGSQRSDRQVYDVQVEIKDVDLAESFLCGYLRIQGLTDDHPTLTTFFEGEIIGPKHLFKTTHASWGSTEKVDLQHWARFPAWRPLAKSAKSPNFTLKNFQQREHLFMRWKEYFLVPDHRVKTITGASFEGFYYICFNQCDGKVSGIYFHAKSEKYQQLELQHVEDHGCMGAVQFR